jgi:hypothetical protein
MNKKTKLVAAIVVIFTLTLIAKLAEAPTKPSITELEPMPLALNDLTELTVVQDFTYIKFSDTETIDRADAIFLGKVVSISPTRWNQDSGAPWNDGLLIHEIEFEVIRPIVDTIGLGEQATITMLGNSPLDGYAENNFEIGSQAVIFVRQTDLAWREGGSRPISQLVGDPVDAYYLQRNDGLYQGRPGKAAQSFNEIVNQVRQKRPTLVQP